MHIKFLCKFAPTKKTRRWFIQNTINFSAAAAGIATGHGFEQSHQGRFPEKATCGKKGLGKGIYMGVFLKWWYPTTMGFPTKNDHFGVFWGYHHLRKHPYTSPTKISQRCIWVNRGDISTNTMEELCHVLSKCCAPSKFQIGISSPISSDVSIRWS